MARKTRLKRPQMVYVRPSVLLNLRKSAAALHFPSRRPSFEASDGSLGPILQNSISDKFSSQSQILDKFPPKKNRSRVCIMVNNLGCKIF
jgi:hypothetical protein